MRFWIRQVLFEYFRHKWLLLLFVTVFFCMGIFFGAVAVKTISVDQADHLGGYLNGFLEKVSSTPISEQLFFRQNVLSNLYIMFAIFVLGLTIIGIPLVLVTVFSKGFILGFTVGFLVREKALRGLAFALLSVLPQNLIIIPAVIFGSVTALSFSALLIKRRFKAHNTAIANQLGIYTAVMVFLSLLTCAGGIIETYVTPTMIRTAATYIR